MKRVVFLMEEKDLGNDDPYSAAIIWWYGILEKLGYDVSYYDYWNFDFENFYKEVKEFKPEFIFHPTYVKVHSEFIKLKELAKTYVIHSDDDYRFDDFARLWIPIVTGTISFCGGEESMKKLYKDAGALEHQFIKGGWCFNPNTMTHEHNMERTFHLSHVGNVYGERIQKINDFNNFGIPIKVFKKSMYEDTKKILAQSFFSLSFTKSANYYCNQVKGRIFEIPYSCALISEPFPDMEKYYDLDKEIIVFNSIPEACEKIRKHIVDDTWKDLYLAGKKRLLSNYTSYHIWNNKILPKIDPDYVPVDVNKVLKENHGI